LIKGLPCASSEHTLPKHHFILPLQ
jgi:hypothetical protein